MIDEIICIGTSYTWGEGNCPKRNSKLVKIYKDKFNIDVTRETHSYPAFLQKILNIKTRNLGLSGSGIEYLVRNVEELLENEDLSNKHLVLEYGNWGRMELFSNKINRFIVANWGPTDGKDGKNGWSSHLTEDYAYEYEDTPHAVVEFHNEIDTFNKFLDSFHNENEFLIKNDRIFLNLLYKLTHLGISFTIIPLEPFFWNVLQKTDILINNTLLFKTEKGNYGLHSFMTYHKLTITDISNTQIINNHPSIEGYRKIAKMIYLNMKLKNII